MTGQCYYCAAGEHHECMSLACTCCGERNRKFEAEVAEAVIGLRRLLAGKKKVQVQLSDGERESVMIVRKM